MGLVEIAQLEGDTAWRHDDHFAVAKRAPQKMSQNDTLPESIGHREK
jgi:hypothetical protein